MAKIEFAPSDLQKVQAKADELTKGQATYPFDVTFKHSYRRGVVLPRVGHPEIIKVDEDVVLTVQTPEQAFDLCSDIAYLAGHHKIDKFATLTTASRASTKETTTEVKAQ